MACAITIDIPTGHLLNGKIVDIEVTGTASVPDCDAVEVTVNCSGFPGKKQGAVDGAGKWKVVFTSADPLVLDNCICDDEVTVFVQCLKTTVQGVPPQPVPGCTAEWSGELPCKLACPDINWLIPKPDPKCNPDGTRNVSNLGAVVTNPVLPVISAQLEWLEGKLVLDGPKQAAGAVSLGPVTHAFPSGTQTLHVTVISPSACGGSSSPFQVDPCGPIGACCLPVLGVLNATACEEMTKAECEAKGGAYQGDGTKCDQVVCAGPPKENGGNGDGGGGPSACGPFTYVVAFLLGLTICAVLVIGTLSCMGVPVPQIVLGITAGLAIATVAVIVLWYGLCALGICPCPTGCEWLEIIWIAVFASAIVALYLSGCCAAMLILSIGMFALALLLFGGWIAQCKPDACTILGDLALAVASGAVVALVWIMILPALKGCGLTPVLVTASTFGGLLVVAFAACKKANP